MKIKELKNLHLEDYYWRLLFGKSKHRSNFFQLRASGFKGLPAPVFFLSTGRCGTNWFTDLMAHEPEIKAFHEPSPNLGVQGKVAYEVYKRSDFNPPAGESQLLQEVFLTAREQFLRYSFKTQRRYVETNNQITFLAPAIHAVLPNAKFVHLNRHPGAFVRSALRRKFYNNPDDIKRIIPIEKDPYHGKWESFSDLQKNSWLWFETNNFIEKFKSQIPTENHYYFNFSELHENKVKELFDFIGISISGSTIRRAIGKPRNVQTSGKLEGFDDWNDQDKQDLMEICKGLAEIYNYQI